MDIREAAYSGNIQALRVLVDEEGADVNEPNKVNQWTPLHWAAKGGNTNVVRLLLARGANKNAKNAKGETPADVASNQAVREILGAEGTVDFKAGKDFGFTLSGSSTCAVEDIAPNYANVSKERLSAQSDDNVPAFVANQAPLSGGPTSQIIPPVAIPASASGPVVPASTATPAASTQPIILLKIKRKGEEDFYEVELAERTYSALTAAVTQELEIDDAKEKIAKIRKLPNVLIRKDVDVARLENEQEIEVEFAPL